LSRAVREAFVRLYEDGLIYRGKRIVNWCPGCRTAISDLEVIHEETQGKLYEIRYPVVESEDARVDAGDPTAESRGTLPAPSVAARETNARAGSPASTQPEFITIATTRPETMLGDTGIAVNPRDERYTHLHGRRVRLPLAPERRIGSKG